MAEANIPDWAQEAPSEPKAVAVPDWAAEETPKVKKPFKDEDFPEYQKLVRDRKTTPEGLTAWLKSKGYGDTQNAEEVLDYNRRYPNAKILNEYRGDDSPAVTEEENPAMRALSLGLGDVAQGLGNALGLVSNPLNAGLNWAGIPQALTGEPLGTDLGQSSREALNLPSPETDLEKLASAINQGGVSGLAGAGVAGGAAKALTGRTAEFAKLMAASPVADAAGGASAQTGSELAAQADLPLPLQIAAGVVAGVAGGAGAGAATKRIASKLSEPSLVERLAAEGIKVSDLPEGITPKAAVDAIEKLRKLKTEAAGFKTSADPKPTDYFPTDESRAANAEAWAKSLGDPRPSPVSPSVTTPKTIGEQGPTDMTPQPSKAKFNTSDPSPPEPAPISKKEAEAQLKALTGTPETQNTAQWGKSLEQQAKAFQASKKLPTKSTDAAETTTNTSSRPEMESVDATPQPANTDEVVARLTSALKSAGTVSKEQKALYTAERAKRFAQVRKAQEEGGGKAAYEKSLAAMSGELPKADFKSVADQFSPQDVDTLFDSISSSSMSSGSKLSAQAGLSKLLNGEIPQPKQLENLAEVFPPDFIKAAMSNRSKIAKTGGLFGELWNVPKSLQSTADLSGPLRQGLGLIHRGEFWKSLGPMLKAAVSSKAEANLETAIKTHPNYDIANEAGLSITTAGKLGVKEDMFRSHLAEKIPVWGKVVQGSERAYVGFLNKLRFDTFNSLLSQAGRIGHDLKDPEIAKGIARYVNVMTGRGGLGSLESSVGALNNVFYSPGLISSRLQILTAPVAAAGGKGFIAELPKGMRSEALKSYAGIVGFNTAALSVAAFAGNSVGLDPLSSEFLKMKDGDTRLDFGGGLSQYIVAGARALTRKSTSSGDNGQTRELKRDGDTPLDNDLTFVMNKMHPTLTLLLDQQRGTTSVGEPFEWQKGIVQRLTPMGFPDIAATLKEHGADPGAYYAFLGLVGAGLSNYHSKSDDAVTDEEIIKETGDLGSAPDWAK